MWQVDDSAYVFVRSARNVRGAAFVALWWGALIVLYLTLDASALIVLLLALASLPALFDIGSGATSELRITGSDISWRSGRRGGQLSRAQLDSVRLDTRLDLSLRMTLLTRAGKKMRLPYECIPGARAIETALNAQGIPYQRHHFTLLS